MPRYQLRRPSPVRVIPRQVRRQDPAASSVPPAAPEVEEGPESPDSPFSSPSTVGALSEAEESDDEAEPPSPVESGASAPAVEASSATSTVAAVSTTSPVAAVSTTSPAVESSQTTLQTSSIPATTPDITSQSTTNAALPQITGGEPPTETTSRPSPTTTVQLPTSLVSNLPQDQTISSSLPPPPPPLPPPESNNAGDTGAPQRSIPHREPTIMTKGSAVAATVLGVLGAIALIIGVVVLIKRRKRRQNAYNQRLGDDAFNPSNTGSLHAPETAHVSRGVSFLNFRGGGTDPNDSHLTRSSDRSNTLFGPATYSRPETVSTDRNHSRIPPTPNPFADPPLNKAYDVLAGRPRSTTLTDRGSWIKNPFRDPESERFDPFGELQEKARRERVRHMEEVRKEAEFAREREILAEREKQFAMKEKMGLTPDGLPGRNGSSVTIEGLGVLDRSGSGSYR
ncbi:Nn.00g031840.m01.CDS01 [Neocucurbitaria sp. VM-36]